MAISPITEGDTTAIVKMNAAIDKANLVDGKASAPALASEISVRSSQFSDLQTQIAARATAASVSMLDALQTNARIAGLGAEAQARIAADLALSERVDSRVAYAEVAAEHDRLGEPGRFATADLGGAPEAVAPLNGLKVVDPANGAVVAIRAGYVATLAVFRVEPGRRYRLRFVVQRAEDTADPSNDAVRLGVAWLKANKALQSLAVLADLLDIRVTSGRLEFTYVVSRVDGDTVDAVCPAAAVYARPFVRCYGSGLTYIEVIEWSDLSNTLNWSPDVSEFRNEIAGVSQRINIAEEHLAGLAGGFAAHIEAVSRAAYGLVDTDADFTISAASDARLIRHTATLSQTRQASIIVPGAQAGSTVRVVRSGGGSFPLNVGPGLKAMSAGTWADFAFNGTAWFLAASGAL